VTRENRRDDGIGSAVKGIWVLQKTTAVIHSSTRWMPLSIGTYWIRTDRCLGRLTISIIQLSENGPFYFASE
jgi:hypothetical protein